VVRRLRSARGRSTRPIRRARIRDAIASPLILVRLDPAEIKLPPERRAWAPEGILAYSKICTHAGCAIALYRNPLFDRVEPGHALVCPCHYSTFDPSTGGTVLFGPAGRPLPQLPLSIAADRTLRAAGNLSGPAGPGWWGVRSRPDVAMKRDPLENPIRFVDERTNSARFLRKALRYLFPDHWSFLLGEVALYAFIVLVATGIFLALFFEPSLHKTVYEGSYGPLRGAEVSGAYASAVDMSFDVKAGLLMRQTHHWAADVFVAAIVVHVLRVFFTGAFRRPRELTYLVGLAMLMLALLEGYLGYSMVDDLLSGMGLAIGYGVALSVPARRRQPRTRAVGRAVPRRCGVRVAHVHRPRVPAAGGDRHADRHPRRADRRRATTRSSAACAARPTARSSACRPSPARRRARWR
jgi:nitrite reductase/ring-hydroxylating ferredoxin subunit